jgi:hypothetical protein
MHRRIALGLLCLPLLLVACTPSSPPIDRVDPPPEATAAPKPVPPPPEPSDACGQQIADYLASRAELSHCESDSDCAELWPGLCPHGPYYIHRDADIEPILALERAIMDNCELPDCEPPMELGIAHCEQGKCAPGRAAPKSPKRSKHMNHMSCWDYRETWLEGDGGASASTSSMIQGITPHLAIAPAAAGVLVLEVDWPVDCADCRLLISEHNSGMAQLIAGTSTRTQAERNGAAVVRERIEVRVTPGPYHMLGMAEKAANYTIRADLRDNAGDQGRVTRHGVGWQRMCEG